MNGKEKCKMLKKMRARIAKEHEIEGFEYKECPYDGACTGTCPACDLETEELYYALKEAGAKVKSNHKRDTEALYLDILKSETPIMMGYPEPLAQLNLPKENIEQKPMFDGELIADDVLRGKVVRNDFDDKQIKHDKTQKKPRGLLGKIQRKKDDEE